MSNSPMWFNTFYNRVGEIKGVCLVVYTDMFYSPNNIYHFPQEHSKKKTQSWKLLFIRNFPAALAADVEKIFSNFSFWKEKTITGGAKNFTFPT